MLKSTGWIAHLIFLITFFYECAILYPKLFHCTWYHGIGGDCISAHPLSWKLNLGRDRDPDINNYYVLWYKRKCENFRKMIYHTVCLCVSQFLNALIQYYLPGPKCTGGSCSLRWPRTSRWEGSWAWSPRPAWLSELPSGFSRGQKLQSHYGIKNVSFQTLVA